MAEITREIVADMPMGDLRSYIRDVAMVCDLPELEGINDRMLRLQCQLNDALRGKISLKQTTGDGK